MYFRHVWTHPHWFSMGLDVNRECLVPPCVFSTGLDVNGEGLVPPFVFSMHLDPNGNGSTHPHMFSKCFDANGEDFIPSKGVLPSCNMLYCIYIPYNVIIIIYLLVTQPVAQQPELLTRPESLGY